MSGAGDRFPVAKRGPVPASGIGRRDLAYLSRMQARAVLPSGLPSRGKTADDVSWVLSGGGCKNQELLDDHFDQDTVPAWRTSLVTDAEVVGMTPEGFLRRLRAGGR